MSSPTDLVTLGDTVDQERWPGPTSLPRSYSVAFDEYLVHTEQEILHRIALFLQIQPGEEVVMYRNEDFRRNVYEVIGRE